MGRFQFPTLQEGGRDDTAITRVWEDSCLQREPPIRSSNLRSTLEHELSTLALQGNATEFTASLKGKPRTHTAAAQELLFGSIRMSVGGDTNARLYCRILYYLRLGYMVLYDTVL